MQKKIFQKILAIILWDLLIFYQSFLSPQVKRILIISNTQGIYEFPHELPNDETVQKLKLNFSRSVLFHTNIKICLIYFGQDCSIWFDVNCVL